MSKNMRLLLALAQRDWSQGDLARESKVSQATINKLCNEHHLPTIRTAYKLSQALDRGFIELGWDLEGTGELDHARPERSRREQAERVERGDSDD